MVKRAHAVMVLGTASNAGKTTIAAALCRIAARRGIRVAPFKAQNMSLNSAATAEGLEFGRAQAFQAEAAGVAPAADMNPVLLKAFAPDVSQAVVDGRIFGNVASRDFAGRTKQLFWERITAAYDRLSAVYDLIVVEGAGSPAEINLREHDIVNMSVAHYADARCLLVADIDLGGAFAAVAGTFALLDNTDRDRFVGYAFNKFRGDPTLLEPGFKTLDRHVKVPCLGVVPHIDMAGIDDEDSVALTERFKANDPWPSSPNHLRIAVIALPHTSNFTDFVELAEEPWVALRFTNAEHIMASADVIVLPGTKSTMSDLAWLRSKQLSSAIHCAVRSEKIVIGICGGMQMLGERIADPMRVESGGEVDGLNLLPIVTEFDPSKVTRLVHGATDLFGEPQQFNGYEIRVGRSLYGRNCRSFAQLRTTADENYVQDGAVSFGGRVVGTYVHGLFAEDHLRHAFVRWARNLRGLAPPLALKLIREMRAGRIDCLADVVERSIDVDALLPSFLHCTS